MLPTRLLFSTIDINLVIDSCDDIIKDQKETHSNYRLEIVVVL